MEAAVIPIIDAPHAPGTPPVAPATQGGPEFLNRDLSWLEFNRRVLHEALDDRTPLLERLRFLGIFTSNLDEFFMKRVGGLKRRLKAGPTTTGPDGLNAAQVVSAIRHSIMPMLKQQAECYTKTLRPALAEAGVHLLDWDELTEPERE